MLIYSYTNLYAPIYRPRITDYVHPCLFFHSDSARTFYDGFDPSSFVPVNPIYISIYELGTMGSPVHSQDAYWFGYWLLMFADLRWAWEYEIAGHTEIGYFYEDSNQDTSYSGLVPNLGWSYHRPILQGSSFYFEREANGDLDIVSSQVNSSIGGFSLPQALVENLGDERNPSVDLGNLVFEMNWNGNWDIAFWHPYLTESEIVTSDPADDLNPIVYYAAGHIHVFWESNRDGTWRIYWSQRDAVGVQPEPDRTFPGELSLSVYPNPGNAEFRIELGLPVGGQARAGIYDVQGRLVDELYNGRMQNGSQSFFWDASGMPSGVYLLQVEDDGSLKRQKIVLVK